MAEVLNADSAQMLERMVQTKQLSQQDAEILQRAKVSCSSEEEVLRWLASEYGLGFSRLEDVEPDRAVLSAFPARILLKEQLLPLRRVNGKVEVATSRLFATQGLDSLKTHSVQQLTPVLAPGEAIGGEIKKRLGVGADTSGTLQEEAGLEVVDENRE